MYIPVWILVFLVVVWPHVYQFIGQYLRGFFSKEVNMEQPVWKTRDGKELRVCNMTTGHIKNALAMLRRNGFVSPQAASLYLGYPPPNGEMAYDCWEAEFDAVMDAPTSIFIDLFEAELKRRSNSNIKEISNEQHTRSTGL